MSQQPLNRLTIAELGARFGVQLSHAYAQIITLEKELADQMNIVQALGANETKLLDHIHGIETQLADMGKVQGQPEPKSVLQGLDGS